MNNVQDTVQAVAFLYRWRLKPGKQAQFIEAWTRSTEALRTQGGSFGSRLHHGSDGLWYGYAMWPSAEARERGFAADLAPDNFQAMQDAVEEMLPEIKLDPLVDRLAPVSLADSVLVDVVEGRG